MENKKICIAIDTKDKKNNIIMARYDHINRETSAKRQILYAPSWRKYLTYSPKASNWQLQTDKLVKSDYFNGILAFLNNEKLSDYLEKNDLELHVKLHPIIAEQGSELVSVSCDRIKILNCDVKVKVEEYCAFITDFSSYVFDYACLNRPIMYYVIPIHAELTEYIKDRVKIIYHENQWYLSEVEEKKPEKEIWLYYDCSGVTIDNGLKQFCHDIAMSDGIDRYYVLTDKKQNKYIPPKANTVIFGSKKHVELLLQASKIITAFIENNNVFPFPEKEYSRYANQMHFETIYLQHGVLHIDMPWKYSPEKIIADKIVVACDVDYRIFRKNGFAKTDLWKVGLPRFDELHKANKSDKQRILYAPSWRSYLVGENVNGDWKALDKKFLSSRYYMETKAFLESDVLYKMLEKQEYTLDVKVHPIFQKYADNFIGSNDRIHLKSSINEEDYSLMITDFSSYMFDFLYLGTAIFSFIPDYQEFKCGMNGYRNVDFMTKIDEEEIAKTSDEIINKIEKFFMTRKGMLYDVHFWKNDICNATELIYQKMTNQPCKH